MNGGWVFEHRWIVEQSIGRYLRSDEAIHHLNGMKDDNRLENLLIMDAKAHAVLSVRDHQASVNEKLQQLAEYQRRFGPLDPSDTFLHEFVRAWHMSSSADLDISRFPTLQRLMTERRTSRADES